MQKRDRVTQLRIDSGEQAHAGEVDPAAILQRIREILAELAWRIPRLLLVQADDAPDAGALASEVCVLERRLTGYAQTIEQRLDLGRGEFPQPGAAGGESAPAEAHGEGEPKGAVQSTEDLEALQRDLAAVLAAVDSFVDRPDSEEGRTRLDARLRDAELRLQANTGESVVTPASLPLHRRPAPRELSTAGLDSLTGTGEGAASTPAGEALPARERAARTRWVPPAAGGLERAREPELAGLRARVRRLEMQAKAGVFLLIASVLLGAAWWWASRPLPPSSESGGGAPAATSRGVPGEGWPPAAQRLGARLDSLEERVARLSGRVPDGPEGVAGNRKAPAAHPARSEGDAAPAAGREAAPSPGREAGPNAGKGDNPSAAPAGGARSSSRKPPDTDTIAPSLDSPPPVDGEGDVLATSRPGEVGGPDPRALQAPAFGIQLIAFTDKAAMSEFIRGTELGEDAVYSRSSSRADSWFIVIKGFFATRDEAVRAADALSPRLKALQPLIRRYPAGTRFVPVGVR